MKNRAIKDIYKLIKKYDVITIYGHVNPDPDCYGSSLALREIIKDNFKGKEVYALGYGSEKLYDRLSTYDEVSDDKIKQSLAIICDCSEIERVSEQRIRLAKQIIKIDHHIESKPFIGVKWVDNGSIACAQMIAEFAFTYKLKISKLAAELMYLGICTDSGRFRYAPTNAKTHLIVSKLYDLGIEPKSIFSIIYQSEEAFVKYQALLITKFQKTEHNVIYCFADVKDYEQFGLKFDQVSKNVNVLGNIIGCPIWCLFTRSPEGVIRIEFRSAGLDVQKVALKYGGGGHRQAAGARLENQKDFKLSKEVVKDLDLLAEKGTFE